MADPDQRWDLSGVRRLSQRDQLRTLAVTAAAAALLFGFGPWLWRVIFAPTLAPPPPTATGFFRPTRQQWAGLQFTRIQSRPFPGVVVTDGQVAVNDETTTQVFSPYSGRVTSLPAELGAHVAKGEPLMIVAATEAVQARNDLIAAADAVDAAEAQESVATKNEERQRALYAGQSAALKDWQQAQSDLADAHATLVTARTALETARSKLRILGIGDNEVIALEKNRSAAGLGSRATVFAPIAGTVIQRQVGMGEYIQSGASTPLFSIGDLSTVWIVANVREGDAPKIRTGDSLEAQIAALPHRHFSASVEWMAPSIDPTTHRYTVRAKLQNADGLLKPMMFATVEVHVGGDRLSPAAPDDAVVYEGDSAHVWLARADHSLALRNVRTGRERDGETEILAGLKPGDVVVSRGALFIDRAAEPES